MSLSFTFTQWAKQPEVQEAWKQIADKNGLVQKDLGNVDRIFGFLDGMMLMSYPLYFRSVHLDCGRSWIEANGDAYSTDKARKHGFFGMVDSQECILEVFNDFAELKMIPPVPMAGGKFEKL